METGGIKSLKSKEKMEYGEKENGDRRMGKRNPEDGKAKAEIEIIFRI